MVECMWIVLAVLLIAVIALSGAIISAQREKIRQLRTAVNQWSQDCRRLDRYNERLTERCWQLANKDPIVIQPPDVAAIVHQVGESIGTAIYGRQQDAVQDLQKQMRETSMVHEQPKPGEWFPDVEFDTTMAAMPTKGGWINSESNGDMPPPPDQTPSHVVINGKLVRTDGQSIFQSGAGAPMPSGGIEE